MATFTWDHIHLRSPDPEATATWFERIFGAQLIRTNENGKARVDVVLGGGKIFIAPLAPDVKEPPAHPHQGLDHFGLTVNGIDGIVADLKSKGVEVTSGPTTVRPGVRVCFLRGPQGISIELVDRNAA